MKISVINADKKNDKLTLLFGGVSTVYANTLRRLIVDEVPTMAVDEVEIRKNNSILYDEMLAHRVGLIPLKTDLKSYVTPQQAEKTGKGPASYQVKLALKAAKQGFVYSEELKSKDPAITPVHEKMIIAKLLKGQTIEMEATAVLGRGRDHVKWSPGHAYYRHKPQLDIGNVKNPAEVVEATQEGVFELNGNKLKVVDEKLMQYDLAGAAEDASQGAITEKNSDEIIFTIESWGKLPCKKILAQAVDEFDTMLDEFSEAVKAL